MEERGTFFFFLFFFSRLKTHQNKQKEIQNFENTYSLLHSLSAIIKRAVVIKRDVFAFFFVFFSRWG